jgi:hypothetical protein
VLLTATARYLGAAQLLCRAPPPLAEKRDVRDVRFSPHSDQIADIAHFAFVPDSNICGTGNRSVQLCGLAYDEARECCAGRTARFTPGNSRNAGNEDAACASCVDAVGSPSGLCASIAEVVSSACATRPARAQAGANARLAQSICLDYEALTSPAPSNTFPLSYNRYRSSSASLIHNLISFLCVRVITIMRQNYFWSADCRNSRVQRPCRVRTRRCRYCGGQDRADPPAYPELRRSDRSGSVWCPVQSPDRQS